MGITLSDKEKIFNECLLSLGAGVRNVELTDDQLETALKLSIDYYSEAVQNFLIESQWTSLYGAEVSKTDFSFALSVRSLDFVDKFTYAYSKQVGLQARGPWELKKDYFDIEAGRQVYQIPAGREINEVLWFTPPTTDAALYANYGGFDRGLGAGFGQMASGNTSTSGYYIAPAYDVLAMAQDLKMKQQLLRGDLSYKITAGPDGTRLIHLLSVPGSKLSFGGRAGMGGGMLGMAGCRVWYHYYDVTPENVDECRKDNPDIILVPNEVPLNELDYSTFNAPTKVFIKRIFMAEAKRILAYNRGKFSGQLGPEQAQLKMDYEMFLTAAKEEKEQAMTELKERLERMMPEKMLERMANEAEQLNRQLKFRPSGGIFLI